MTDASRSLLVLCSRLKAGPDLLALISECLRDEVDWDDLMRRAGKEGTLPLLGRTLRYFPEKVPASVFSQIQKAYYQNTLRNLSLFRILNPLLQSLEKAPLRVAITKGAALTETLYREAGLRPFTDIDFIVEPSSWKAIEGLLGRHGFHCQAGLPPAPSAGSPRLNWTHSPYYLKGRLLIELHFNYLGLHIPLRTESEFWDSTRIVKIGDSPARVLSPEYELCYLCLHAQQHSYNRLIWLVDIAEMASGAMVDWNRLIRICEAEGVTTSVYYGLHLADTLWPGTVDPKLWKEFRVKSLGKRINRFLWPENKVQERNLTAEAPYYMPTIFALGKRKKVFSALRAVLDIYFPPRTWVAQAYGLRMNSLKMFGHYLQRLFSPLVLVFRKCLGIG